MSGRGGIGGTGIFGLFGTVVQCSSTDTSLYCSLAKLINIIFMILILCVVLYAIWSFLRGGMKLGEMKMGGMKGGYISRESRHKK